MLFVCYNKYVMYMNEIWEEAKSTNLTDGIEVSSFLEELIEKNIKKEKTLEDVLKELIEHYDEN